MDTICIKDGCEHESYGDYPACFTCAHTVHFTNRRCLCDACNPEREAAQIVNLAQFAAAIRAIVARPIEMKEAA